MNPCRPIATTMTWLGGQGEERRQPGPGTNKARRYNHLSVGAGGVHLPAPSTDIPVPQDAKLSTLAPESSEPLEIMKPISETLRLNKCHRCLFTTYHLF
jgi:hypothetical protein